MEAIRYKDGFVEISLRIPEGLLKSFTQLLGTLEGFFTHLSYRTRITKLIESAKEPAEIERRNNFRKDFTEKVLSSYDAFVSDGLPAREAIKQTNKALKAEEHPWACYDLVLAEVRKAGRLKGSGMYSSTKKKGSENA